MFAVVDRGTARTPWEFSLGFGNAGSSGTLFVSSPKTRNEHPVERGGMLDTSVVFHSNFRN